MDTIQAAMMGMMNREQPSKVFDWYKAARLIIQHGAQNAGAGLAEDWEWTGGTILEDGKIVLDSYTFLSSTWATPIVRLFNASDGCKDYECYIMESDTEWDHNTKWPDSAIGILANASRIEELREEIENQANINEILDKNENHGII